MRSGSERARRAPAVGAGALAVLALLATGPARAAGGPDVTYGRVAGDLTLVGGVGAVLGQYGARGEVEARLRYFETAGLFVSYEEGPAFASPADPLRILATGLEVRPLFLFRWLDGHETSGARLDLLVDSIGLELGAAFQQPEGASFGSKPAAQAGLAIELPVFASATGPWLGLHGGVRWSDRALAGVSTSGRDDQVLYLSITAAWHQVVLSRAVDVGDGPAR